MYLVLSGISVIQTDIKISVQKPVVLNKQSGLLFFIPLVTWHESGFVLLVAPVISMTPNACEALAYLLPNFC